MQNLASSLAMIMRPMNHKAAATVVIIYMKDVQDSPNVPYSIEA